MFGKNATALIFLESFTRASVVELNVKAFHNVEANGELTFGFGVDMGEDLHIFPVDRSIAVFFMGC